MFLRKEIEPTKYDFSITIIPFKETDSILHYSQKNLDLIEHNKIPNYYVDYIYELYTDPENKLVESNTLFKAFITSNYSESEMTEM